MLIDAQYPDEVRVAVVKDGHIVDFDIETQDKRQLRGNIYLAKIAGVEPSLQAAFVEYGGNRHGFLAFDEIHPDYFQIPQEDREALLVEQAELAASSQSADDTGEGKPDLGEDKIDTSTGTEVETTGSDAENSSSASPDASTDIHTDMASESEVDEVREADKRLRRRQWRRYRIQEVIKKRQVILVQVVKEERGNKGAALTTYLSLAGRYCVLMPNTSRGGGVSRKITRQADRKRLKKIVDQLEVPSGMGLIVRTAGASCNRTDIERDYTYLGRLWSDIRRTVLDSTAPYLVHEEASLVLRSVRDLYDPDIDSILVQGDDTRAEVERNVNLLMPDDKEKVKPHDAAVPLFSAFGLEQQIESIFHPMVELPSGGYLVINQTEALVTIDVNSGRATRERSIETTAVKTNLEAAEAAAVQMRLRDLAGLIVIDFIDMEEKRNIRTVEKAMKKALQGDRARVQHGSISNFGLMELSRQRRRAGIASLTSVTCPNCCGNGQIRAPQSMMLKVMRALWARVAPGKRGDIVVRVNQDTALRLLNGMREQLTAFEQHSSNAVIVEVDASLSANQIVVGRVIDGRFRELAERAVSPDKLEQASRRLSRRSGRAHDESPKPQQADTQSKTRTVGDGGNIPAKRGSPAVRNRRIPEIAIDGGEMLDAVASAPFLLSGARPSLPVQPVQVVAAVEPADTSPPDAELASQGAEPEICAPGGAMTATAQEVGKPRQGWWSRRSAS